MHEITETQGPTSKGRKGKKMKGRKREGKEGEGVGPARPQYFVLQPRLDVVFVCQCSSSAGNHIRFAHARKL